MAEKVEKEKKVPSFWDIAKGINKACKDWDILGSGNFAKNLRKLPLRALAFDLPFRGGLPYGQIITFSGVEHSGKSTGAIETMAQYQLENSDKICLYVDVENTLLTQAEYFQSIAPISYEPEHFARYDCTGKSAEEIFQDIIALQAAPNIGMIVIDSARAMVSQADLDNEFTKDNGQRASIAKPMGKFLKQMMMYLPKRNNILLVINQVDVVKDLYSTTYTEPCGYALKYFPSVKVRFGTRTYTCKSKTDIKQNELTAKGKTPIIADGIQLHFAIVKSRLGGMTKDGGYITIRYNKGIDTISDLISAGIPAGFIQQPDGKQCELVNIDTGEVYTDEESKKELIFSGEQALINYLDAHPAFVKTFYDMILAHIGDAKPLVNLLDEEIMADLLKQEADTTGGDQMTEAEALAADGADE